MAKRTRKQGVFSGGRAMTGYMQNTRDNHFGWAVNNMLGNGANIVASRGRNDKGRFMTKGDRNAYRAYARATAQNQRTDNYDYTQPSNYSHTRRYNDIRSAFGLNRT